jgi:hypothetical protein
MQRPPAQSRRSGRCGPANDCAATSRPARLSPRTRGKPIRARERYACSAPLAPSSPRRRRRSGSDHHRAYRALPLLLLEGLGETIGETKRHSSSSSASALIPCVLLAAIRAQQALGAEVAALERTLVHRDTRIDGLVRLGASDHDLGDRDSPRRSGRCEVYAARGTARARASASESRARTVRSAFYLPVVDRAATVSPEPRRLRASTPRPGSINHAQTPSLRPSLLSAGLQAAGLVPLVVPLTRALG